MGGHYENDVEVDVARSATTESRPQLSIAASHAGVNALRALIHLAKCSDLIPGCKGLCLRDHMLVDRRRGVVDSVKLVLTMHA